MQYEESCLYHEKDQVGDVNAWELFFEQPTKFKLKDVLISKNIILSTNKVEGAFDLNIQYLLKNKNNLNSWIEITDKFLRYNKKTSNYLESNYKNYIPKNKKVLGVSVRAGYIKGKYKGHPVQPGIEELIDRVKRCFTKYNYDLVFLSVEDYEVVHKFKEEFNEKLLVVKRPRLNDVNFNISKNSDFNNKLYKKESKNTVEESSLENLNNFMDTISFERKNDKYLKGLEYMSEMYILSKLDGLICGETSGTVATVLRNKNGFDNLYFYNLGVY